MLQVLEKHSLQTVVALIRFCSNVYKATVHTRHSVIILKQAVCEQGVFSIASVGLLLTTEYCFSLDLQQLAMRCFFFFFGTSLVQGKLWFIWWLLKNRKSIQGSLEDPCM